MSDSTCINGSFHTYVSLWSINATLFFYAISSGKFQFSVIWNTWFAKDLDTFLLIKAQLAFIIFHDGEFLLKFYVIDFVNSHSIYK